MAPTPDMTLSNGTAVSEDYYKTEDTQYSSMSHAGVIALVVFIIREQKLLLILYAD